MDTLSHMENYDDDLLFVMLEEHDHDNNKAHYKIKNKYFLQNARKIEFHNVS